MKKTAIAIVFLLGLLTLASCHKDKEIEVKSPVVSGEEMTVAETQANISWKVDYVGNFHTGVDVSTHENMSEARRVEANKVDGKYVAVVDGLTAGTKYYYRIVVWNKYGSFEEEGSEFMTEEKTFYLVKVTCSPADGGRVTGAGSYEENKYCMLNAIPSEGYNFVKWTENGNPVSTNANYTFKVTQNCNLVAHFAKQKFTISLSASPSGGGTVSGGGECEYGQSCTVSATAASGYTFSKWTENGTQVSTNANYTFTVNSARTLVAHFTALQGDEYNVNVSASPSEGGTVMGGGVFQSGASCTVTATANTGYTFANWTENGSVVSSSASYTFTVNANRTLVANFTAQSYTISVSANPSAGGSVTGGGTYNYGDDCTVVATANSGYTFTNWKEGGSVVSSEASYSFTVTGNRTLEAVFTAQAPNEYTITVSANPTNGGTVSGGGTYQDGQSCTVTASANSGYTFTKWTENGTQVSTDADYTFTVTGNRTLVAHFAVGYTITVSANPSNGGSVSGGGTYSNGQGCVVRAVANSGYTFTNWTENGNVVSTDPDYGFIVTRDRTLLANFVNNPQAPTGAINGLFTINDNGDQVYFSQGNLQYIGSSNTPYWKFADNQWDYLGTSTGQNSGSQNVDRDLFGWGTSGYNHGAVCYEPWSTSKTNSDYFAYGQSNQNLGDQTGQADWGYNPITNGGNASNTWRTLTCLEWQYVFDTRSTPSDIRFARAVVNDVNGFVLLPDNWNSSIYELSETNLSYSNSGYTINTISATDWIEILEPNGAVFLPAAGTRYGTSVSKLGSFGYYWSATYRDSNLSQNVIFSEDYINTSTSKNRSYCLSVRLVRDANP